MSVVCKALGMHSSSEALELFNMAVFAEIYMHACVQLLLNLTSGYLIPSAKTVVN